MRSRSRLIVMAVLVGAALSALPGPAAAGFIIQEQEYSSDDPELKATTISSIQNGRIRFQDKEDVIYYVWSLAEGKIFQVNGEAKVYAGGTFEEELEGMKKYMVQLQKELVGEEEEGGEAVVATAPKREKAAVSVVKTGETVTIAGYKSVKYEVRSGDRVVEELWISPDLNLSKDFDYLKFKRMFQNWMNVISDAMSEMGEEASPEWLRSVDYLNLFKEGYVMKRVEYLDEGSFTTEVTKVESKDIAPAEFEVPSGFRKVSTKEFMEGEE